jgi:hypothetical protein
MEIVLAIRGWILSDMKKSRGRVHRDEETGTLIANQEYGAIAVSPPCRK